MFDRSSFRCGSGALDEYFVIAYRRMSARRDYMLRPPVRKTRSSLYTLAATGLLLSDLPGTTAKKLPLSSCAAVLMGRLAVDTRSAGRVWRALQPMQLSVCGDPR